MTLPSLSSCTRLFVLVGSLFILLLCFLATRPSFEGGTYHFHDRKVRTFQGSPKFVRGAEENFIADVHMTFPSIHPTHYYIVADDCLLGVRVQGKDVPIRDFPGCKYPFGQTIDLGKYIQTGKNLFQFKIRNHVDSTGVKIRSAPFDPLNILLFLFFALIVLWYTEPYWWSYIAHVHPKKITILGFLGFLVVVVGYIFPHNIERGEVYDVSVQWEEEEKVDTLLPYLRENAPVSNFVVQFHIDLPRTHNTLYKFFPDDCIERIEVNHTLVESSVLPFCLYPTGKTISLTQYLKKGTNNIRVYMKNNVGDASLHVQSSSFDFLNIVVKLPFLILLYCFFHVVLVFVSDRKNRLHWLELHLFFAYLVVSSFSFFIHLFDNRGWDLGAYLEMVHVLSWTNPIPNSVNQTFYSYHPPLGFLLTRTLYDAGLDPLIAGKLLAFLASLVTFFFLRGTLARLRLLAEPAGIAFLYIATSIPAFVYLANNVNLDVQVLAYTSMALYFSVVLVLWKEKRNSINYYLSLFALCFALFAGLMTKFSGLVSFSLPFVVFGAFFLTGRKYSVSNIIRAFQIPFLVVFVAGALAFPYYHLRYYQSEGTYFPSNGVVYDAGKQERGHEILQKDPWGYFARLFQKASYISAPEHRDLESNRLIDAWDDFWIRDIGIGGQYWLSWLMSRLYLALSPILMMLGFLVYLLSLRRNNLSEHWNTFGIILLSFTFLQVAALVVYLFRSPCTNCFGSKGIYIAPAMWGVAFVLSCILWLPKVLRVRDQHAVPLWHYILLALVALFIVTNFLIPVY